MRTLLTRAIIVCAALVIVAVLAVNSTPLDFLFSKALALTTKIVREHTPDRAEYVQAALAAPAPPVASGTYMNLGNAQDYPPNFRPYASSSVWNTPISSRPTFLPNSAAIVAAQFPGGRNPIPVHSTEAGQYDYNHPRFFANSSDPLVHIVCTKYCGAPDNGGVPQEIRIPAKARPAGGADAHFDVVQPNGTEIDMWATYGSPGSSTTWNAPHDMQTRNWQTGDTLTASNIANCGSFSAGQGWLQVGPGSTAAGYCTNAGVVTAAELLSGHIDHAVFVGAQCAIGNQYPVEGGGSTGQCPSRVGPPLGGREWYDVPCATT